ncbi:hypothetical protein [Pseudomonas akapageensis]|uniref:hypothetical protein n=1 Tax=Pseudomonas akapageensis TaxID=2609961 RepID=UPI00140BA439|nr:hypothetical protein [Pseudomonas akapageensis]
MRLAPLLLALVSTGTALACSYDGKPMDLEAAHPYSLDVAIAIHDAYQRQQLQRYVPLQGGFGLRRAQLTLGKLDAVLRPVNSSQAFNLLLVEPGLWSTFDYTQAPPALTMHTAGPQAGVPTVVTGEGVLMALLKGQLTFDTALKTGLLRISGSEEQHQAVIRILSAIDVSAAPV